MARRIFRNSMRNLEGAIGRTASRITPPKSYRQPLLYTYRLAIFGASIAFVTEHYCRIAPVSGTSMSPTLSPDNSTTGARDWVLIGKGSEIYRLKRGDIVSFWAPHRQHWESVKRIIAFPGDTVIRDPRRLAKEQEENHKHSADLSLDPLPAVIKIPPGHCWVEGDNWRLSRDSNDFGPICYNLITGRAVGIVWPFDRMRSFARKDERTGGEARKTVVIKAERWATVGSVDEGLKEYKEAKRAAAQAV